MKKLIITIILGLTISIGYSQSEKDLVGTWNYHSVTTTNPNCKDVDYFPITTFKFSENGRAEFRSSEGTAKASYKLDNNIIELFDLSENGVKQEGSAQFQLKSVTKTALTITVEYECGSIDILFKK